MTTAAAHRTRLAHARDAACERGGWDAAGLPRGDVWCGVWHDTPLPPAPAPADADAAVAVDAADTAAAADAAVAADASPGVHPDEAQVELDVRRSFTTWPAGAVGHLDTRRAQLSAVLQETLRTYPYLHYYQGLHDIVAVVLLTLCEGTDHDGPWRTPEAHARVRAVVAHICLSFVRDAMCADLLPALGQLKIVHHIVRAADAPYAYALEHAFAPSHVVVALPWLLTLFTHDAPTLGAAQRMLDFVFTHGPASTLYVCATLLLLQKHAALKCIESGDAAALHQQLAHAPRTHMASDAALTKTLRHAAHLLHLYPLRCPAVHAHQVLSAESVLFTWPRDDGVDIPRLLAMPSSYLALDPMPTPRDEQHTAFFDGAAHSAARRHSRLRLLFPHAFGMRPVRRILLYPRALLVSSLSLLLGGSIVSILLAMHVASSLSHVRT